MTHSGTITPITAVSSDYISLADIKANLPDEDFTSTKYDALLALLATCCSRLVDNFCRVRAGEFIADATALYRYYDGSGRERQWIDPCVAVTELSVDEDGNGAFTLWTVYDTTTMLGDYLVWPYNRDPYTPIERLDVCTLTANKSEFYDFQNGIRVKAQWGKTGSSLVQPPFVTQAALITAIRAFKRAQQLYQDTGAISELGQLRYVAKLDPEAQLVLEANGFVM